LCSGGRRCGGLAVLSADGLDDQPITDGFGADLDADDPPVNNGPDLLDVGLEFARGDAGGLGAHAAEVLGLAAVRDLVAGMSLLASEITNAGHNEAPLKWPANRGRKGTGI